MSVIWTFPLPYLAFFLLWRSPIACQYSWLAASFSFRKIVPLHLRPLPKLPSFSCRHRRSDIVWQKQYRLNRLKTKLVLWFLLFICYKCLAGKETFLMVSNQRRLSVCRFKGSKRQNSNSVAPISRFQSLPICRQRFPAKIEKIPAVAFRGSVEQKEVICGPVEAVALMEAPAWRVAGRRRKAWSHWRRRSRRC